MIWITALLLFVTGCGKEPLTPAPPPPTPTPLPTELSKQWHLVGFVHAADSTVTPPGRMACKGCFSLVLGADGTISGQGFLTVASNTSRPCARRFATKSSPPDACGCITTAGRITCCFVNGGRRTARSRPRCSIICGSCRALSGRRTAWCRKCSLGTADDATACRCSRTA